MGLLGYALASGINQAATGAADIVGKNIISQMEEAKAMRIAEFSQRLKAAGEDDARIKQSTDIESRAAKIAGGRKVASDEVNAEGDAAATAYAQAEAEGRIDSAGAKLGMIGAADYVNRNATPDTNVTQDDRTQAAIQGGYITPKDAAAISDKEAKREMATAIAQGKWESALQIAQLKGDFSMALGEMKAAAANGDGKATEMMRNWKFLESQGYSKEDIASKLTEGKVGEYTTIETEKDNMDGSKTKTVQKIKAGGATQPAPANRRPLGEVLGGAKPAKKEDPKPAAQVKPAALETSQASAANPDSGSSRDAAKAEYQSQLDALLKIPEQQSNATIRKKIGDLRLMISQYN